MTWENSSYRRHYFLDQKDTSEMLLNHTAAGIGYSFDEPNLISASGLVPVMRLAQSAGLKSLADQLITVANTGADKGANPGAKIMSLVAGMATGANSIDDVKGQFNLHV